MLVPPPTTTTTTTTTTWRDIAALSKRQKMYRLCLIRPLIRRPKQPPLQRPPPRPLRRWNHIIWLPPLLRLAVVVVGTMATNATRVILITKTLIRKHSFRMYLMEYHYSPMVTRSLYRCNNTIKRISWPMYQKWHIRKVLLKRTTTRIKITTIWIVTYEIIITRNKVWPAMAVPVVTTVRQHFNWSLYQVLVLRLFKRRIRIIGIDIRRRVVPPVIVISVVIIQTLPPWHRYRMSNKCYSRVEIMTAPCVVYMEILDDRIQNWQQEIQINIVTNIIIWSDQNNRNIISTVLLWMIRTVRVAVAIVNTR